MADKTPRTDAVQALLLARGEDLRAHDITELWELARQLERENADLSAKLARAQAAVQFADNLIDSAESGLDYYEFRDQHAQAIREAKEAA